MAFRSGAGSRAGLAFAAGALLLLGAFGLALLARGAGTAAAQSPEEERPNVVVIETDDQTLESMRVMPNTRNLIGGQGVTFSNSFVNWSVCCPSRATMLTGQYSHNHGVLGNSLPLGSFDRLDSTNTLPVWLQGAGYYTGLIGKYLNGYERHRNDPGGPLIPPGYSEWRGSTRTYDFYGYELNEGGTLTTYGALTDNPDAPSDPNQYSTDVYNAKAVDFVNRRAPSDQPFYLWLSYLAPHSGGPNPGGNSCAGTAKPAPRHLDVFDNEPLPQPPSFNEADVSDKPPSIQDRVLDPDDPEDSADDISDITRFYRCRLASLLSIDEGVAQIYSALKASGELNDTLIVFTSDNGFMHGEHRVKSGKVVPYEESIRVPLMIRGPGFRGGKTVGDLATNADVAKTVVRATGARAARRLDGYALQPFAEQPGRERGRELSIETNLYSGVRTERYTYVEYTSGPSSGFQELYDNDADPFQLQNVAANPAYASVRAALDARLERVRSCAGDGCRLAPKLRVKLLKRSGPGGCLRAPVRAKLKGFDVGRTRLTEFFVNGKRVLSDRKRPFKRKLPYGRLGQKKKSTLRVRATLLDGRRLTIDEKISVCR